MLQTFESFGLDPSILEAIQNMGFQSPSPIQQQAIPQILQGCDLVALSQTGSGKTAACAIPVCHRVQIQRPAIQALVVVPTRELALQYAQEVQKIGRKKGVKAFAICGGESASLQLSKLRHGVHVLVATPGRLIDFIYSRSIDLSQVEVLVLDEADEMLGMGFYEDLEFIMGCLIQPHQTLLFSATMPEAIGRLATKHMRHPQELNLLKESRSPGNISHQFLYCPQHQRDHELAQLLQTLEVKQAIVFCHSRFQVEKVCQSLKKETCVQGVDFLHAGLQQNVRSMITKKFRSGKIQVLVATDVVARGLDFSSLSHVFIYQLPRDPESYLHRSGRTGRYDKSGVVISLVTERELPLLKPILHHLQQEPTWLGTPPPLAHNKPKAKPKRPHFACREKKARVYTKKKT